MQECYFTIGDSAGKIYRALEGEGPLTTTKLKAKAGIEDSALFNQAIGWLARENKIGFEKDGKSLKITLNTANV